MTNTTRLRQMEEAATRASALMKTLGHRGRLMVLCQLAEQEWSVNELSQRVGLSQSTLSQQLARLRNEGLVKTRREGQTIYYQLGDGDTKRLIRALYDIYCPD